ncbi:MAG: Gfo/Idh/MocA family oxidoreductase [Acidobacteriota bacterium]|nr:Gfo/Idh/MocA family oxidoreductase [Acidobacteriota bacterium]
MSAPEGVLRVAVVGAGAFGRNHLRVYRELQQVGYPVELVAVVDPSESARAAAVAKFGVRGFATVAEMTEGFAPGAPGAATNENAGILRSAQNDKQGCSAQDDKQRSFAQNDRRGENPGRIDAASVCVPTVHHAACARELMACGIDLLIEKPLAPSLAEADEIATGAREQGRIVQVGHLERFNPAVRAVLGRLNKPMFFEVHRLSIFTLRSLDVDVVLDLMIHDLDIVTKLVGEPVREVRAVGLPVLSRKVDIANVRLEFENGCVANFTASRVSTERVRKMRFFQPHQYLSLDFARQDLLLIDVSAAAGMDLAKMASLEANRIPPTLRDGAAKDGATLSNPTRDGGTVLEGAPGPSHPSPGMELSKVPVEQGEPLKLEIEAFLEAVRTRSQPVVTLEDGRAALALALEINSSIAEHARRTGL